MLVKIIQFFQKLNLAYFQPMELNALFQSAGGGDIHVLRAQETAFKEQNISFLLCKKSFPKYIM